MNYTLHLSISYNLVYINKQNLEKVQLEFEIIIQFCFMCLSLCEEHTIIIHLSLYHVSA